MTASLLQNTFGTYFATTMPSPVLYNCSTRYNGRCNKVDNCIATTVVSPLSERGVRDASLLSNDRCISSERQPPSHPFDVEEHLSALTPNSCSFVVLALVQPRTDNQFSIFPRHQKDHNLYNIKRRINHFFSPCHSLPLPSTTAATRQAWSRR